MIFEGILDRSVYALAGMNVLAGSTLGGGTRVNWQASFRTPDHVRQEWAHEHGLRAFASKKYDEALDAVCTRLGVTTGWSHPQGKCYSVFISKFRCNNRVYHKLSAKASHLSDMPITALCCKHMKRMRASCLANKS